MLVDDEQEEDHGDEPADPTRSAVTGDHTVSRVLDHEANAALGDNVRHAVTNPDGHHCLCGVDAKHLEQVSDWVCYMMTVTN